MKNKSKKQDFILIAVILVIVCILLAGRQLIFRGSGSMVEISVDGTLYQTLPLNRDTELTIPGDKSGTNHLVIKDGYAYVDDASCPDKVCIHQGKIHETGEMVVCLPNKMIAKVISGSQ